MTAIATENQYKPVKQAILEEVRHHAKCRHDLIEYFDYITPQTLENWFNSPVHQRRFTEIGALAIIAAHLNKSKTELLEMEVSA